MEYTIVEHEVWESGGYAPGSMIEKVNDKIKQGWIPVGGVCNVKDRTYYQAMTKKLPTITEPVDPDIAKSLRDALDFIINHIYQKGFDVGQNSEGYDNALEKTGELVYAHDFIQKAVQQYVKDIGLNNER